MKKIDWGWQGRARKLRERTEYLLKHLPIPADITFEFGVEEDTRDRLRNWEEESEDEDEDEEDDGVNSREAPVDIEIHAHKIFLAIGSEVFYAMFYGPAADVNVKKVTIPNYSKAVFKAMVDFLYTDSVDCLDEKPFTHLDITMDLLRCCLQYGVPGLAVQCRKKIVEEMQTYDSSFAAPMLCTLLNLARELAETEIQEAVLRNADRCATDVFESDKPKYITKEFVEEILQRSELNLKDEDEYELYTSTLKWATTNEISKQGLVRGTKLTGEYQRRLLGSMFNLIRFPLMTPSQLADGPIKEKILTPEEVVNIFQLKFSQAAAAAPPDLQRAVFSKVPRCSRPAEEIGCLSFEIEWREKPGRWMRIFETDIVPDKKNQPEASARFLNLCRKGYPFQVCVGSANMGRRIIKEQDEFLKTADAPTMELFAPPSVVVDSSQHDKGGTVALLFFENRNAFILRISPSSITKDDQDVVFGRLLHWDKNIQAMKAFIRIQTPYTREFTLRVTSSVGVRPSYSP